MKNPDTRFENQNEPRATQEEPFLRRWSKRKLETSKANEEGVNSSQTQHQQLDPVKPEIDQKQLELTDEDMPPLETLDENSDYSGFFSPRVSETLRTLALRKLFHFQQFNITDGLNDYDDDYTKFEKLGNTVTHEMKRLLEREQEKDVHQKPQQHATTDATSEPHIDKGSEEPGAEIDTGTDHSENAEEDIETDKELI